jgi:two-component system, LytTR family, response regulator
MLIVQLQVLKLCLRFTNQIYKWYMKITAIIIDDEKHCINTLTYLLQNNCNEVDIIATADNAKDGASLITDLQPQLVFLDVQMPYKTGIEMLAEMPLIQSKVIFTTAYDLYAIKAIKLNALDYLLKPIDGIELIQAINKYKLLPQPTLLMQLKNVAKQVNNKIADVLAITATHGLEFLKMKDIVLLEADNTYTHIYTKEGEKKTVSKNLLYFEELLPDVFFRCHKSYIINLHEIKSYIRGDAGEIVMSNKKIVSLSRNKKDVFLNLFGKG